MSSPALAWPVTATATAARDEERSLVLASRHGDREAFDRLVERYQREVYRLCYRYVGGHEDASDLAQDVFLRAWRSIGRFRGDSALRTWLYRIAINACLNHRAAKRPPTLELPDTLPDPARGAESRAEAEDDARRVRGAILQLPEKQRATLILKLYHELSHEEVAEALGSSVGTVKSNLFHALSNLRRRLGEEAAR